MILAWAGFGVAYKLTDRVRAMLKGYNAGFRSDGFQLITERGSATWILLAGAVSPTLLAEDLRAMLTLLAPTYARPPVNLVPMAHYKAVTCVYTCS
jgi:hypothetical protein